MDRSDLQQLSKEQLIELVNAGSIRIVVDLENVEFLDSTGLGVLVGGLRRVRARDGAQRLAVANAGTIPDRGLFGVHLPDGTRNVRKARKDLGADAIVGAFCGAALTNNPATPATMGHAEDVPPNLDV